MADVPAKMRERNKYLTQIRDVTAMPLVAQTPCLIGQLRERSLFKPDKERESPIAPTSSGCPACIRVTPKADGK
jgi:hypothetical protein